MSKRSLTLTDQQLWLRPSGTDCHRPSIATIRELEHKNWRKRSGDGEARRKEMTQASLQKAKDKAQARRSGRGGRYEMHTVSKYGGKGKGKDSGKMMPKGKGKTKGKTPWTTPAQPRSWDRSFGSWWWP